jgi:hypothetical protein
MLLPPKVSGKKEVMTEAIACKNERSSRSA